MAHWKWYKVAWLINEESRTWNEEKLRMLNDEEADAIRQIPLGEMSDADLISWPFSKNGCYTVRSGYHFIQQKRMEQDYRDANKQETSRPEENRYRRWEPPVQGSLKINVDAASDGEGRNGLGMIVRDSRGQFSYAQTRSVPHLRDVQTLELLAIKSACIWCKERQIKDIIIESDAKMVVQMLKDDDAQRRDQYQLIVRDIQNISHGQRFTFRWIPRDANNVAHLLASFAKSNHGEHNWQDDPPEFPESSSFV